MALGTPIIFTPLFLEDHDRSRATLIDDLRRNLCAFHQWLSDENALVAMNQPDLAQYHSAAHLARKTFDLKDSPGLSPGARAAAPA